MGRYFLRLFCEQKSLLEKIVSEKTTWETKRRGIRTVEESFKMEKQVALVILLLCVCFCLFVCLFPPEGKGCYWVETSPHSTPGFQQSWRRFGLGDEVKWISYGCNLEVCRWMCVGPRSRVTSTGMFPSSPQWHRAPAQELSFGPAALHSTT